MATPRAPRRAVVTAPDKPPPPWSVERTLLRQGNLRVELTRKLDSFQRAVTITRQRRDGRSTSLTLFAGDELDDVIDALCDAADELEAG